MLSAIGNYMLDQVRTLACSTDQQAVGGREGVLIYVKMNINYDQTVFKRRGGEGSNLLGPSSQVRQQSFMNSLSSQVHKWDHTFAFLCLVYSIMSSKLTNVFVNGRISFPSIFE